jgi:hypothetical protein
MGKGVEYTFLQIRYTNGQQAYEKKCLISGVIRGLGAGDSHL